MAAGASGEAAPAARDLDRIVDRDHDEYELESEHAGPRYPRVVRWSF